MQHMNDKVHTLSKLTISSLSLRSSAHLPLRSGVISPCEGHSAAQLDLTSCMSNNEKLLIKKGILLIKLMKIIWTHYHLTQHKV
ncbi:uncharacterized protein LOC143215944 isoform X3 [Lasioglossum baleicum]|uniref:uncharacterized protein LOC143215944 isoform X3 n=1 Tax=Lasioglossum baleicum TaxID=434251 RepID=UPI003FCCCB1D